MHWRSFIGLTLEAAAFLAERRVGCVGVDYLSVSGFHEDTPAVHRRVRSCARGPGDSRRHYG